MGYGKLFNELEYKVIRPLATWLINLSLVILKLKKRDEKLWLFGSWNGENYSDNSKYLFEYITKNMPEINAVWITKNEEVKKELLQNKKKCYMYNEKTGRKLRLRAKYVFFTNGITDIGNFDFSHGSIKIALWHGMPLKKLGYATNNIQKKKKNPIRLFQYIFLKLYNPSQRDITIATSKLTKEFLIKSFEVREDAVFITGQPRNDVLFDPKISYIIKNKLMHKENEKFVLYMPTWRQFKQQEVFLDNIIEELLKDINFMKKLKEYNIKLYIKPHPRVYVKSKSEGNIFVLNNDYNLDTQEIMAAADLLITDYSSVFIDYALMERPIHFFVPDLEEYKKHGNDLFLSFNEFSKYFFKDIDTLKKVIFNDSPYLEYGKKNSKSINNFFNDPKLQKGQYCKTLIDVFFKNKIMKKGKK